MYLLRHGQSLFNLHFTETGRDPGIADPPLTEEGLRQGRAAGEALAEAGITRIVVSPYRRALQTAAEAASVLGVPVRITALVRERYAFACDVGTHRAALAAEWPMHDFSVLEQDEWWPVEVEPEDAVIGRAERFRAAMRADPEQASTLVVSHWGFLLALTGRSMNNGAWRDWDPAEAAPASIVWQH